MLDDMPIELVGAVFQTAADLYLESDRTTVLNIAKSCSVGYTYAIPVLYRTLTIEETNSTLLEPVFNGTAPFTSGLLSRPATERLCSPVRRLFLSINQIIDVTRFGSLFPHLEAIFVFSDRLTEEDSKHLPSSLRSFHTLSAPQTQWVPFTTTHLCAYWYFGSRMVTNLTEWFRSSVSNNVTHVALELNDSLGPGQEPECLEVLQFLLARVTIAPVAIRLYRDAIDAKSLRIMLKAISKLDSTQQQRVIIWRDKRPIQGGGDDIDASKWDAVYGRTPWSEATPVTQSELDAAVAIENPDAESADQEN